MGVRRDSTVYGVNRHVGCLGRMLLRLPMPECSFDSPSCSAPFEVMLSAATSAARRCRARDCDAAVRPLFHVRFVSRLAASRRDRRGGLVTGDVTNGWDKVAMPAEMLPSSGISGLEKHVTCTDS